MFVFHMQEVLDFHFVSKIFMELHKISHMAKAITQRFWNDKKYQNRFVFSRLFHFMSLRFGIFRCWCRCETTFIFYVCNATICLLLCLFCWNIENDKLITKRVHIFCQTIYSHLQCVELTINLLFCHICYFLHRNLRQ